MTVLHNLQGFFEELRQEGVPITPSQALDCCQATMYVDWARLDYFYSALFSTLVKDYAYQEIFDQVFYRYFNYEISNQSGGAKIVPIRSRQLETPDQISISGGQMALGTSLSRGGAAQSPGGSKNPLDQDFRLDSLADIHKLEAVFPIIARRLAAKMVKKRNRNNPALIDFRRTIRNSMSTGGVPVDIFTVKKTREKPVILTMCDISGSVMTFSCFALALIASLERFFRKIDSFAFIDDIDEITGLLFSGNPLDLRTHVLKNASVVGASGYSDYGVSFKTFHQRYRHYLSHKTSVLIFGDARNNWFNDESWVLQEIKKNVRKVYWFNPEPENSWGMGDSRIYEYQKYCTEVFECSTLLKLEKAISQL
ncbi:carbon monoxide oxidation accessory protein coxe [hydrocarbon metagenome]|uniref:Carbon monoxide oxidation accessory protein coxe n=1 Tax=hydrocarbon metagenome TaxID=938273 RepID=A0A0W8E8K9_9ZZZZ